MAVAERILNLQPLTDTRPDRALVADAQLGDPDAASILIERYYPRIYSFVSHLTYGRANVEDLTQEVFARALKALGRFNGEYQFDHWLLRIAKNLCIDEARRNVRSPELTDPGELPELEGLAAPDYVWESVSRELVASVVHRALAALPPRQRAILVMRELEGMSYADIAQVVGTGPRGVEGTLHRARTRFRVEIARAESAEEASAACRRTLRLVSTGLASTGPQSASSEAANHLATCADCRRRARGRASTPPSRTAFGFLPLGLRGLAGLLHRPATSTSSTMQRVTGRVRDWVLLAGLGTGAAAMVPIARMAEVAGGVVMATAVTLSPVLPAFQAAAPATAVMSAPVQQVATVPAEALLYRSSANAPLTASTGGAIVRTSASPLSITSPSASATPGLLDGLGLGTGAPVAATLNSVATVASILADQLQQVSQLTAATVSNATDALGPLQGATQPVTGATTNALGDLKTTVSGLNQGLQNLKAGVTPGH